MKKIIICLFLVVGCIVNTAHAPIPAGTVYICVTGEVYHASTSCRGLRNAKHDIISVSKDDAINKYKRRACKICY